MNSEQPTAVSPQARSKSLWARASRPDCAMPEVKLIAYELGTCGRGEHLPAPDDGSELAVLVQSDNERAACFAQRVLRQFKTLESAGRRLIQATFVLNSSQSPDAIEARYSLAQAATDRVPNGAAEFVAPGGTGSDRYQHELFGLIERLMADEPAKQRWMRVRFQPAVLERQELALSA